MRVFVDPDKCIGAGLCVASDDRVFDQEANTGTVVLLVEEPPEEWRAKVVEAAQICPSMAITVED
jgi:ferredoxin